jgi:hypothetical protein
LKNLQKVWIGFGTPDFIHNLLYFTSPIIEQIFTTTLSDRIARTSERENKGAERK